MIRVNGIRVYAYHGCLAEEGRIGGQFQVDVCVQGNFSSAEASDSLRETVDYGRVTSIVKEQMAIRANLIEHVARRILDALRAEWPGKLAWQVRVVKEHPPVAGAVDHVVYELEG